MKTSNTKITTFNLLAIFVTTLFVLFSTGNASAQILKPSEIIYSRAATVVGGNCDTAQIWVVGLDGSNDRFITQGLHPRISPDGRYLLFKRYPSNVACYPFLNGAPQWWMRDLARRTETQISQNVAGVAFGHFFSHETNRAGRQIIFDDGSSICTMNIDGTNRTCLIGNLGQMIPMWFPAHPSARGGDDLVVVADYDSNRQPTGGLYTLNYNDISNRQKIPNTSYGDLAPSWSNDGQTIAYAVTNNSNVGSPGPFINLFKIKPDGTGKTQLTSLPQVYLEGFYHGLVWTLDNSTIVNAAKINGVAGIYEIAANGGGILGTIPITAGAPPDWVGGIVPVYSEQQTASFGGGEAINGNFSLVSTIGQGFAGQTSSGGAFNMQSGFWQSSSSSNVAVSGRVLTSGGRGVRNARVNLTDPQNVTTQILTGPFGTYRFENVVPGRTYTVAVMSKRFQFTSRMINLTDELTGVNFIAIP